MVNSLYLNRLLKNMYTQSLSFFKDCQLCRKKKLPKLLFVFVFWINSKYLCIFCCHLLHNFKYIFLNIKLNFFLALLYYKIKLKRIKKKTTFKRTYWKISFKTKYFLIFALLIRRENLLLKTV